uniref:Nitroreductase A n=1 Tax=Opalinidae sp. TaxID=2059444 RepID=A0A649UYX8_9STRA|nr:nitroreductase A [Opalinidae sp.]
MSKTFLEVIDSRISATQFSDKPVSDEIINQILQILSKCPTARNAHCYHICVVKDEKLKQQVAEHSNNQMWIASAPVLLVFFRDIKKRREVTGSDAEEHFSLVDATIACTYAQLAVENLGLKSRWIGGIDNVNMHKLFGLNPLFVATSVLPIGYVNSELKHNHQPYDMKTVTTFH